MCLCVCHKVKQMDLVGGGSQKLSTTHCVSLNPLSSYLCPRIASCLWLMFISLAAQSQRKFHVMERGHCLLVWSSNLLWYHQTNPVLPLWKCPFSSTSCVVAFGPCKSWDQASFRSWWNLHRLHRNNKLMNIHSKLVSKRVTLSFPLYLCLSTKNAHTILMTLFMAWTYPVYHHLITFVHWSLLAKLPILRQVLRVLKTSMAGNNFSTKSFSLLSCTWKTPGWKHGQIPLKIVKLQQFEVLQMLCKN